MNEIDFQTALGRLLIDAALRDQFSREPAMVATQLQVRATEREQFTALSSEEIEIQATILLRKRFETVRCVIPATIGRLGDKAWECFLAHARSHRPGVTTTAGNDAQEFCTYLVDGNSSALCPSEMNRLRFHLNRRSMAMHYIPRFPVQGRIRPALQVLVRHGRGWSEHVIYVALS